MSFNLSCLTRTSVLTLSVLSLSVLSACSNGVSKSDSGTAAAETLYQPNNTDPFDSYYGLPKKAFNRTQNTQSKTESVKSATHSPFKVNAPTSYKVQQGDTLWGISNKFLKNPAYWPEVWDKNQKVKNPHLIFPGDELFIYQGSGKSVNSGNTDNSSSLINEKRVPQMRIIRSSALGEPISTLSPFLLWPHVLDDKAIDSAPYIVGSKDSNILLATDQTVYVKNLKDSHAGGKYAIFNIGKILSDPKTGKIFGREVIYNGSLEVERPAAHGQVATALVISSTREIRRGDKLVYIEDKNHKLRTPITLPNKKIRANVISLFDAKMISAQTQIITINQGKRQGIKTGFTLGVYSPARWIDDPIEKTTSKYMLDAPKPLKLGIPPTRVATAIVYKVLEDISYAVITNSSNVVKNGYKIGNP